MPLTNGSSLIYKPVSKILPSTGQMLCGELPFQGDSITNLMYNIANEKHPDIRRFRSDLPNCVNNVINKALQKEAKDRFASGKQMAASMKRCQEHIKEMNAA